MFFHQTAEGIAAHTDIRTAICSLQNEYAFLLGICLMFLRSYLFF